MTESERAQAMTQVFGGRAAGGLAAILDKLRVGVKTASGATYFGADAMRALAGEMRNSAGEVDKALDSMSPWEKATMESKAAWDNLKLSLGQAVLPGLTIAINAVSDAVKWMTDLWRALPAPLRDALGYVAALVGPALILGGGIKMIANGLTLVRTASLLLSGGKVAAAAAAAAGAGGKVAAAGAAAGTAGLAAVAVPLASVAAVVGAFWAVGEARTVKSMEQRPSGRPLEEALAGIRAQGITDSTKILAALERAPGISREDLDIAREYFTEQAAAGVAEITAAGARVSPETPPEMMGPLPPSPAARGETIVSGPIVAPSVAAAEAAQRQSGGTSPPPAPGRAGGTVVIRPRVDVHFDRDGIRTMVQEEVRSNDALGYAPVPEEVD
jgi:hypothetical protein